MKNLNALAISISVLGLPLWAALAVGLGVVVVVLAANVSALATIPATVFGLLSARWGAAMTKQQVAN